ncbi:MAG TPA: family B DNA polymerase [Nitrospirota bacterium]
MQTVVFRKQKDEYHRDTRMLNGYVDQASFYLHKTKDISLPEAREFVIANMKPGGLFEFHDPKVRFLYRDNFEDRRLEETTMSKFLSDVITNDESLSPTFTSYCSPDIRQSLLSLYTMDNIVGRDISKGQMFDAKNAGDDVLYIFKNLEQNNKKTTNNSLSGASLTPSTCLFNPTSHSSLTTNCRNTTAYGNANNEKFIEGNRHYMDVDTILNNLVSISQITDMENVETAIRIFGLAYPTSDDVLSCIERSKDLYFPSNKMMGPVYEFISKMSPLERAAFVYVGDFYHLYKHNKSFVADLLGRLIWIPKESLPVEEADFVLKAVSEDTLNLARQLCREFSKGMKPKEIKKASEHNYGILAHVAKNINDVLVGVQPIINAFWLSDNMPASTGNFPTSIRRSVLGGDTDSTLFTVQEWIERIYGTIGFTDEMNATSDVVVYLAAQTSSHLHAKMSANYGVHRDRLFDVQMKNEYKFDIFVPTLMAKHYWAMKSAQEGNVFKMPELELKGANMISSATPGDIVKNVKQFLLDQMKEIVAGKDIYLDDLIDIISKKENEIYSDVKSGKTEYFKMAHLKPAKAYKVQDEDRTPYWNHLFWNRTFGRVYGMVDEPPYTMLKVSLEVNNVTEFATWLEQIKDQRLVEDIKEEMARIGRKILTTIYVPVSIVQISGIPDEILIGSNARKIVRESCGAYYHILEAMGVAMANKKNTRMIYDLY